MSKKTVVLKDLIAESKDGEWGKGETFDGSVEMLVVRATDFESVQGSRLTDIPRRHIPPAIATRKELQPRDIIIETAGGGKDRPTGRTLFLGDRFFSKANLPVTCASFCRFIRIDPSKAFPQYVYWHLQHLYNANYMRQFHTQHTGVARFQFTTFATTQQFQIPDHATQRKIAAVLGAYDELIENNRRRIEILEEMARRLYREWFVQFRFPGHAHVPLTDSPLGKIPKGWEVKTLRDLSSQVDYGFTAKATQEPVGPKFLRITDIVPSLIDWDSVPHCPIPDNKRNKFLLADGDIVIARTGATVGYAKRIDAKSPVSVFASYLVRLRIRPEYDNNFVGLIVESDDYKRYVNAHMGGAAQPNANAQVLASFPVVIPTADIRDRFREIIGDVFIQRGILRTKIANLQTTRDLLLPRLISGELDVSELPIAVEEAARDGE